MATQLVHKLITNGIMGNNSATGYAKWPFVSIVHDGTSEKLMGVLCQMRHFLRVGTQDYKSVEENVHPCLTDDWVINCY